MKFPKVWLPISGQSLGGAVGAANARSLADGGSPFVAKLTPDSDAQHTPYDLDEVHLLGGSDGFFSVGDLGVSGANTLVSSSSARGTFAVRGAFSANFGGGFVGLLYVGNGFAIVANQVGSTITYYKTRTGKDFTQLLSFVTTADNNTGFSAFGVAAAVGANGFQSFGWGVLDAPGAPHYIHTDDGGVSIARANIPYFAGVANSIPSIFRVGPTTLLGLVGVYTQGYAPYFIISQDNGSTWIALSCAALWSQYKTAGLTSAQWAAQVVDTITSLEVMPMRHGKALAVLGFTSTTGSRNYKTAIYDPTVSTTAMTFVGTLPVLSSQHLAAGSFLHSNDYLVVQFVRATTSTADTLAFVLVSADNGVTWAQQFLPFTFTCTGGVYPIDPATWVMMAYDGAYSMYQSTDFGVTWAKRATVYNSATAPAPAPSSSWLDMNRFGALTYMRLNDSPAPIYPATPWVGDSRVSQPV